MSLLMTPNEIRVEVATVFGIPHYSWEIEDYQAIARDQVKHMSKAILEWVENENYYATRGYMKNQLLKCLKADGIEL